VQPRSQSTPEYTQELKTMERRAAIDSHAPQADREYSLKEN